MPAPFTFQPGYIQMYVLTPVKVLENLFTFQPGYIQMSELATLEDVEKILYIPTWLYSNPSPIIPSIQDILNPIFCLPGYSQVQNYYGGCILLLLNIHLPLFYNICRTLYIL